MDMVTKVGMAIESAMKQEAMRGGVDGAINPIAARERVARAAIAAMVEPTDEMIDAAVAEGGDQDFGGYEARCIWQDMITAALSPRHDGE